LSDGLGLRCIYEKLARVLEDACVVDVPSWDVTVVVCTAPDS
jgi:hypothetical protein